MKAQDVMVSPVVTVSPQTSVRDIAKLLLDRRISGVPVVDDKGKVVGIVSEGDLLHRAEADTERKRPWWLQALTSTETLAVEYAKAHAQKAADIMTTKVITVAPDMPLHEVASVLEKNSIKRVPVVRDGQLVGIVSRANLLHALASTRLGLDIPLADATIREKLLAHLRTQSWAHPDLLNVIVVDGVVELWGIADSTAERKAIRIAAESMPGVRAVRDNMALRPPMAGV